MCTTDCYCYNGPNGAYQRKWEEMLSEEEFNKFNRTSKQLMSFKNEDPDIPLYPM
jgi:hypothetical protein